MTRETRDKVFAAGIFIGVLSLIPISQAVSDLVDRKIAKEELDAKKRLARSKVWIDKANKKADCINYWKIQDKYNELIDEVIEEAEDILRKNA